MPNPDELVGSAEIARRLGVQQRTVISWAQSGGFPQPAAAPHPRRFFWRWGDVLTWHAARPARRHPTYPRRTLPAREVDKLRRELVAVSRRRAADAERWAVLLRLLREQGTTWEDLGALAGVSKDAARRAATKGERA